MSLFETLWEYKGKLPEVVIHATLKRDAEYPLRDSDEVTTIPAGTRVRIWMISRFGDAGITPDLTDKATGYCARVGSWGEPPRIPVRNPGRLEDWLGDVTLKGKPCEGSTT